MSTSCPDDSGPRPSSPSVNQLYQVNRARVRGPAGLTSCPGDSRTAPMALGMTHSPGQLCPVYIGPRGRPADPVVSGKGPSSRGVEELSRMTRARVGRPTVLTSSPMRLALGSKGPWYRRALPGDAGSGPMACELD